MGHERVGFLPKTRRWNDLIKQIGTVYSSGIPVAVIAAQTLHNVQKQYEALFKNSVVKASFAFLVAFSHSCRLPDPRNELQSFEIPIADCPTVFSVVKALRERVSSDESVSEYGQLALAAASDAVYQWYKQHATTQIPLFEPSNKFFESWRGLGNGAGFCELARLYFGKLTERYLNYFLDRVASAAIPSIEQREQFQQDIHSHIDDISKHAFESAKITQSFAAGWFNAHTREGLPDAKEIEGFLNIAFGKLRDELRREEEAK